MDSTNVLPMADHYPHLQKLQWHLEQQIIGQEALVKRMLIALLAGGHLLVEGLPGLAKTKAIKALAHSIEGTFHRVQFTPDLLPADLTGTDIYRPETGEFVFQMGPLFHNFVLADEINRAPAKVQSALLEAMAEQQITIGQHSYALPKLYMVMATQNPIEHEGTYSLPEAQLDRFLMYLKMDYPPAKSEHKILSLAREEAKHEIRPAKNTDVIVSEQSILKVRKAILDLHMSEPLEQYLVELVLASRTPQRYGPELKQWVRFGASPRGTIALDRCARAHAWLAKRDFVTPEDIQAVAPDVLRHRIILSYEAQATGVTADNVVAHILKNVCVP